MSLDRKKNVSKVYHEDQASSTLSNELCYSADNLSASIFDIFKEDNNNVVPTCQSAEQSLGLVQPLSPNFVDPFGSEILLGYKSHSMPYLKQNGSTQSRKKTSEASPLFDSTMPAKMQNQIIYLKEKLDLSEDNIKQLLSAKNALEEQCKLTNQKYAAALKENHQVKAELNKIISNKDKEINQKDETISKLKKKLSDCFNNLEDKSAPSSGASSKKQNEQNQDHIENRHNHDQTMLLQELSVLKENCQYLKKALWEHGQCKMILENEVQKLKLHASTVREIPAMNITETTNVSKNDMELLRQQLEIYAEDFNAEKTEKEKLAVENHTLRKQISLLTEEKEPLMRQLQYYEEDFRKERDKRIELLRKSTPTPVEHSSVHSSFSLSPTYTDSEAQRKWKEYCCLVVEKESIADRINELENQGITRYNGRSFDQSSIYSNHSHRGRPSAITPPAQQKTFQRSSENYNRTEIDWPNNSFGNRMGSESNFDASYHHYRP